MVAGNVEPSHHFVGLADFDRGVLVDGDGDLDVVVGEHNLEHPEMARLLLFENLDGRGGRWREHVLYTGDEHHDGAIAVDIDGDGDVDMISIGWPYPESTGIIESHQLVAALLADAEQAGATLVAHTPVVSRKVESDRRDLAAHWRRRSDRFALSFPGQFGWPVRPGTGTAHRGLSNPVRAAHLLCKTGHCFTLRGRTPFQHLAHPMPDHSGWTFTSRSTLAASARSDLTSAAGPCRPIIHSRRVWRTSSTGQSAATTLTFQTARSIQATRGLGPR
mgnify:CR=1 FL=1